MTLSVARSPEVFIVRVSAPHWFYRLIVTACSNFIIVRCMRAQSPLMMNAVLRMVYHIIVLLNDLLSTTFTDPDHWPGNQSHSDFTPLTPSGTSLKVVMRKPARRPSPSSLTS